MSKVCAETKHQNKNVVSVVVKGYILCDIINSNSNLTPYKHANSALTRFRVCTITAIYRLARYLRIYAETMYEKTSFMCELNCLVYIKLYNCLTVSYGKGSRKVERTLVRRPISVASAEHSRAICLRNSPRYVPRGFRSRR